MISLEHGWHQDLPEHESRKDKGKQRLCPSPAAEKNQGQGEENQQEELQAQAIVLLGVDKDNLSFIVQR